LAVSTLLATLALAAPAQAADPIMPLSEVQPGMSCTGLSVIHGTTISSFNVQVLDVIAADPTVSGARLLVRVSGPAVDDTGVGPGFSGSPIYCNGKNAGAISAGIGEYGNKVVLATPIEAILGAQPSPARNARKDPALLKAARPWATPLTVTGASPRILALLQKAAKRTGRTLFDAPVGPAGGYPVQNLVPGAAVAASMSTGDLGFGAVGTVAYRDGDQIYAFGHELDAAGERSLFLQDSYVFGVIGNPIGVPDFGAQTYKLASPGGHNVGELTNDTFNAIYGKLGANPPAIPLRTTARLGSQQVALDSAVADERDLGFGGNLSLVAPAAAGTALDRLLDSFEPVAVKLCTRFRVSELKKPIGFCNDYFDPFTGLTDVLRAGGMVDAFDLAPLHIRGAAVSMALKRNFADDVLVKAEGPQRVVRGSKVKVRLTVRRRGGGGSSRTLTLRVPIPSDLKPGNRALVLKGNAFDLNEEDLLFALIALFGEDVGGGGGRRAEPRTVRQLAKAVAGVHRKVGVVAAFKRREDRVVLESDDVAYEGQAKIKFRVVRAHR
jgi:hypothetical protein